MDIIDTGLNVLGYGAATVAVAFLAAKTFVTVPQNHKGLVERFGKFSREIDSGLNVIIPYIEKKRDVSLKINELAFEVKAQTSDRAFLTLPVVLQYVVTDPVAWAYKSLKPIDNIKALIENTVVNHTSNQSFDVVFGARKAEDEANKDTGKSLADEVKEQLKQLSGQIGFEVVRFVLNQPLPSKEIVEASNRLIAAKRLQDAATAEGEATRIKVVAEATANAEAMKLNGQGLADMRAEIAKGLKATLEEFKQAGLTSELALQLMMTTNGQDALRKIGENKNLIVVPMPGLEQVGRPDMAVLIAAARAGSLTPRPAAE